ncbi:hypothetical protein [Arthrobacter sp. AL12]|uniref:hypothetical protein n=1 Tax=Arthrobacter sp. AL12 TaxID=3042241 RepID=UPI00249BFB17|nr:hypothetical protein [Arthrobacter sp. AL12]MDI3212288.1 hypothetical protein [Arthrobacter sp. AL12]
MNLHSQPTPGAEYPAENPIRRHRLLIGSMADVVVQEELAKARNRSVASGLGRNTAPIPAVVESFIDTARHGPTPQSAAEVCFATLLSAVLDHQLRAIISLDVPRDSVHADIDGSLTRVTRASLVEVAERILKLRVGSHIRVNLGSAAFVESAAIAGLRTDLETLGRQAGGRPGHRQVPLQTRALER